MSDLQHTCECGTVLTAQAQGGNALAEWRKSLLAQLMTQHERVCPKRNPPPVQP